MRTILRVVALVTFSLGAASLAALSQEHAKKERRFPVLSVELYPAEGYLPAEGSEAAPAPDAPRRDPNEYARSRELFHFQVVANRPDEVTDDSPVSIVAAGLVRRGETRNVHARNRDLELTGTIRLDRRGVARYEAELLVGGRSVSSTAAILRLDSIR
jgi:hypothetical protein